MYFLSVYRYDPGTRNFPHQNSYAKLKKEAHSYDSGELAYC